MVDANSSIRESTEPIVVTDLGHVDYEETWLRQTETSTARANSDGPDHLWVLTHPSVYTAGCRTQDDDRPAMGIPVIDVDRGGSITWHGPGQLVCYPIIRLAAPIDVVNYVRRIEEAVIATCADFGVHNAGRVDGRTGVWLPAQTLKPERKIAAIGVRTAKRVTMHGVSFNCNNTLAYYDKIVPCGIDDAAVTTLSLETGHDITPETIKEPFVRHLIAAFDGELPVSDHTFTHVPAPNLK